MKRLFTTFLLLAGLVCLGTQAANAQGVTTGAVTGIVTSDGNPVAGANVIAVHQPSGTRYGAITRIDGRYSMPGMRVGGPYTITVSHIGYTTQDVENVMVNLGVAFEVNFTVKERAIEVEGVTVTASGQTAILSPDRTGAATAVSSEALRNLPTVSRRIEDFARLTPQYSGASFGFSFAGQDNRLNNILIDGSYFNSFGLGGQPGDRTGVAPISLDAVEQIQINVAPFDVRQGNFVGAGLNTVTRSGTNDYRGSLYYQFRDQDLVGTEAKGRPFNPGTFDFSQVGGWVSGPIIQNKLFFFFNYEDEGTSQPGTTWTVAGSGSGQETRVRASSLDSIADFLRTNFDYDPGVYQDYPFEIPGKRFLGKLDFNLNTRNKLSLRYNHLDSKTDQLVSNSSSLGRGSRRTNSDALNFSNSNYAILENIRSVVGEWNAMIGSNMANNLIVGYTYQDESRESKGTFFPLVEILEGGRNYTTFGFEPFTPNNELRYKTFQIQNNFSIFGERHSWTFGASAERYESENVFFPGSQSVYVYNSLADFYTDANDYLANPNRTTSPITLNRFQVRYNNIPGQEKPIQPLKVWYTGAYAQDEWQATPRLKITGGLRIDVPFFENTAFQNTAADALTFEDENDQPVQYPTGELPDPKVLFSPRLGFNLDAFGDRSTQVRGGTGIFTGRPAYVWISNQIGNTGVLTGFEQIDNTNTRPFNPDPNTYKPQNVTGAPAASYELALTDPNFKFPQVWRSNIAVDQRLPWGLVGTAEFLYNKDINGVYYINANLADPTGTITEGTLTRPRWTTANNANRIHPNISSAIVLKNQNEGYSWNASASLEKSFESGLFLKGAYTYGVSKNTVDPGSIAAGSWTGNQHHGDPNNPGLGYSAFSPGHRLFFASSLRREWFKFGATSLSLYGEYRTNGSINYTYGSDLNGLIYIPRDISEMNFQQYTQAAVIRNNVEVTPARTFTVQEQEAAWEAYIQQDPYLSEHRGEYAERNAAFGPMVFRADMSLEQELFTNISGKRNAISARVDILNLPNFLNSDWGVGQRWITTSPLVSPSVDVNGEATYRLRNINPTGTQHELITETFETSVGLTDVYRIMFSLRYTFN